MDEVISKILEKKGPDFFCTKISNSNNYGYGYSVKLHKKHPMPDELDRIIEYKVFNNQDEKALVMDLENYLSILR